MGRTEPIASGEADRLWAQAASPRSARYEAVIKELLARNVTLDPTFTIYSASRDLMRARRADWHDQHTLPSLWNFFQPSRDRHGSFYYDWGTEQDVAWRDNHRAAQDGRHRQGPARYCHAGPAGRSCNGTGSLAMTRSRRRG